MKYILSLTISILLVLSCNSNQSSPKIVVVDCTRLGFEQDLWTLNGEPFSGPCKHYENGVIQSLGSFNNGKLHGKQDTHYPNGNLFESVEYTNGTPNGQVKYYHEEGQLDQEGRVENGLKEGIWKFHHNNGNVYQVENWKNNVRQDSIYTYAVNGNLIIRGFMLDGLEEGKWTFLDSITGEIDGYSFFKGGDIIEPDDSIIYKRTDFKL